MARVSLHDHPPGDLAAGRRMVLRLLLAAVVMGPGGSAASAQAAAAPLVVEGQRLDRRVHLAGAELALNGAGVRAVAWFKGFVAALYLPQPARTAQEVVAQPGPKRVQLRMLHEVPAQELARALDKGVRRNSPPEQHAALAPHLQQLGEIIATSGRVQRGDVIDLDFDPAQGLLLSVNGRAQGPAVGGTELYAALLLSFVGERPYDSRLRARLLGG